MKKLFLLIMFIAPIHDSVAFEIKPVGFNSEKWIGEKMPPYKSNEQSDSCDGGFSGAWHKAFSTYPVHEIITASAAKYYCKSDNYKKSKSERNNNVFTLECDYVSGKSSRSSSNSPIVSGAFFNDDPTGRIRDEGYGFLEILRGVIDFGSTINDNKSITYASHNGENQFLHSMKSPGDIDSKATRDRIVEYIAENFNLARYINEQLYSLDESSISHLKTLLEKPIQDSKYGFFLKYKSDQDLEAGCEYEKYINLFYCGESFKWGEYAEEELNEVTISDPAEKTRTLARTLALLALGSSMHAIQDSYSTSHVQRDEKTGKINMFYQYDNGNKPPLEDQSKHCQHDAYVKTNGSSIEKALEKSISFLQLVTIDKNFFKNHSDQHCRESIKKWLNQNVFQLANEDSVPLSSVATRPDACVADAP